MELRRSRRTSRLPEDAANHDRSTYTPISPELAASPECTAAYHGGGDSSSGGGNLPAWTTVASLMASLPESPSPNFSTSSGNSPQPSSSTSERRLSRASTVFLTPRNQESGSGVEIDQWLKTASNFEIHQQGFHGRGGRQLETESPAVAQNHRCRPRPYSEFIDEINRKRLDDQIDEWKRGKHTKYMDMLRKKEEDINDWEAKKTMIAMDEMKTLESKLEKKRVKAMDKMERKVQRAQKKGEEKKERVKKSMLKRVSLITRVSEKIRSLKSTLLVKLMRLF